MSKKNRDKFKVETLDQEKNYRYVEAVEEDKNSAKSNEEILLDALGGVDDKYVEEAKPRLSGKIKVFRIASIAACFMAVVLGGIWVGSLVRKNMTEDAGVKEAESTEFETLDKLLEYLGISKDKKGTGGDKIYYPGIINRNYENSTGMVEAYGGFIYKVCDGELQIRNQKDTQGGDIYTLEGNVNEVAIVKDKLFVLDGYVVEDENKKLKKDTTYRIYDLEVPNEPKLINTYVFNTTGTYMYIIDSEVIFGMSDGACECGHGNGYYAPEVTIDDELVTWSDEEISILGVPSVIQYVAFLEIDLENGGIIEKQVYYGIIEKVSIESGCATIITKTRDGKEDTYVHKMN